MLARPLLLLVATVALSLTLAATAWLPAAVAAQTRSPTRKPTAPTPAPKPICATYGQLPQLLNGNGESDSGNGHGVSTNADASIVAVLSRGGEVTVYSRPANSPTTTLYTKTAEIDLEALFGLVPVDFQQGRYMSMSATGDTLAIALSTSEQLFTNNSIAVLRATSRAFKTFNASLLLQQDAHVSSEPMFGVWVSVSRGGTYIAVGAPGDDVDANVDNGAVVLYRLGGGGEKPWKFGWEATLHQNVPASNTQLGMSTDVTDTGIVLAGATGALNGIGLVYTFARTLDGVFAQQGPALMNPDPLLTSTMFGTAVVLDKKGLTAAVSNFNDNSDVGTSTGSVTFYSRPSVFTTWGSPQRVLPSNQSDALVGYSLALSDDGNVAVAGAPQMSTDNVGSVAFWARFDRNPASGLWATNNMYSSPHLFVPNPALPFIATTMLGKCIAMSSDGSTVVVGSPARASAAGDFFVGAAEVWACGV